MADTLTIGHCTRGSLTSPFNCKPCLTFKKGTHFGSVVASCRDRLLCGERLPLAAGAVLLVSRVPRLNRVLRLGGGDRGCLCPLVWRLAIVRLPVVCSSVVCSSVVCSPGLVPPVRWLLIQWLVVRWLIVRWLPSSISGRVHGR